MAEQVRRAGVTAVLAYNDLMAIGLIEGLDSLGIRVPQEVSVVGIDDIALSRLVRPKLTTVATPTAPPAGRPSTCCSNTTVLPPTATGVGTGPWQQTTVVPPHR